MISFDNYSPEEQNWVKSAYALAQKSLEGVVRSNGNPFMEHPINTSNIVSRDMGLGGRAVAAIFLHEASRLHPELMPEIKSSYPQDIYILVDSLNKIASIRPQNTGLQAENYRKLIVSYSADPQVILIKIADRLEIMRSLESFPKGKQIQKATETMFLYTPMAHQLGLYHQKSELEDLSLKYSNPEDYRYIYNNLQATARDRDAFLENFTAPIKEGLKREGIEYELKSRTKSVFSIWKKMQAQKVDFDGVYDLFAIRIIIESDLDKEVEMCWKVFSIVREHYKPILERMRDWLRQPKPNGYTSLHITVEASPTRVVEVQIRTRRMDIVDEMGLASHWAYKGVQSEKILSQWLGRVRSLMMHPDEEDKSYFDNFQLKEIYAFTPNGDIQKLPEGATVLDFAFSIHSKIGLHCTGARISGRIVPIRTLLETGQVVEVLTSKTQVPSADWLNFVVTGKAKSKIKQKLREDAGRQDRLGREILERRLRNWKMDVSEELIIEVSKFLQYKNISDFFGAVGDESLSPLEVKEAIQKLQSAKNPSTETEVSGSSMPQAEVKAVAVKDKPAGKDFFIIDDRVSQIGYKLAKCCNPIVGDKVFGFVTVSGGVTIHRITCPNASRLLTQYPYRIQAVKWREGIKGEKFQVQIRFKCHDELIITHQVGEVVQNLDMDMRSFSMSKRNGFIYGTIQVSVHSNQQVVLLIKELSKIKGMEFVKRLTN